MMQHIVGDMLVNATSGVIIQGCNCNGVMGSGLALFIRRRWPEVFTEYHDVYRKYGLRLGDIIPVSINDKLTVINCMTQQDAGTDKRYVDYEAVVECMEKINKFFPYAPKELPKIVNIPLIGAGLAGGNWNILEAIIDETLSDDLQKLLWTLPGENLTAPRQSSINIERV